jgi:cell wall-associated NlpC family hydrolase
MMARARFLDFVLAQVDKPALWGAKGPDAFDCSGLVTCGILAAGGPDLRHTHNADKLASETRPLLAIEKPMPGDLIFFDAAGDGVDEHVGVVKDAKTAIDASGASSRITSIEEAIRQLARVRLHLGHYYRKGGRIHRNTYLDSIDMVSA